MLSSARPERSLTLWGVRTLLGIALALSARRGLQYWQGVPTVAQCIDQGASCMGQKFHPRRLLRVISLAQGSSRLAEGAVVFRTESPLDGVRAGDLLEATLTLTSPDQAIVHRFVVLRPWRYQARIALSLLVSAGLFLWACERFRRSRKGSPGCPSS